ncbi:CPCC family cysteine-rich protein [Nonomuraea sp. NPDC003201]
MTAADHPTLDEIRKRRDWILALVEAGGREALFSLPQGEYTCPCCFHPTLRMRGYFGFCEECDWEDDGQDDHDADVVRGGPNGSLSLTEARRIYRELRRLPPLEL